jgi:hypothetical protein
MDWRYGSSSRELALQVQALSSNLRLTTKKKKKAYFNIWLQKIHMLVKDCYWDTVLEQQMKLLTSGLWPQSGLLIH